MNLRALGHLAALALARGAASALGLLAVLLVARALPPDQLGHWSLALAVQGYALHLGELGLRSVVTTEAARAGRRLPELLARYLRLRLAMSALSFALVVVGCLLWRPDALMLVALTVASILPIALQLDWLALVDGRIWLASALLLVRPLAFLLLLALSPELGPMAVARCFLAAWVVAAALSWLALRRPVPDTPGSVPGSARLIRRGASLAGITVTNQLQLSADLLVVGWALGPAAAGDYWLAGQFLVAGLVFANAAGQMALARLPALAQDPGRLGRAVIGEAGRMLGLAVPAAAVAALAAPSLLPALFGTGHAAAAALLPWLLPWFVLQHLTTVVQAGLAAGGRENAALRANLLAATVLLPALAIAALAGSLAAFALARTIAELSRLAAMLLGLSLAGRMRASLPT